MSTCKTTMMYNTLVTALSDDKFRGIRVKISNAVQENSKALFIVGGIMHSNFQKQLIEGIIKKTKDRHEQKKIVAKLPEHDLIAVIPPLKKKLLQKVVPDIKDIKHIVNTFDDDKTYTLSPQSLVELTKNSLKRVLEEYPSVSIVCHSFSGLIVPHAIMKLATENANIKNIKKITLVGPYIFDPRNDFEKIENKNGLRKIQKKLADFYYNVESDFAKSTLDLMHEIFVLEEAKKTNMSKTLLNLIISRGDEYINIDNKWFVFELLGRKLNMREVRFYFPEIRRNNTGKKVHHSYADLILGNREYLSKILIK